MKYLCLAYYDPEKFDTLSEAERAVIAKECQRYDEELNKSGHLVSVASLAHRTAATLRPKNGRPTVTDGPFAEAKEVVGAFFIIEAKDMAEAIWVAGLHPAANWGEHLGFAVEVRPIEMYKEL